MVAITALAFSKASGDLSEIASGCDLTGTIRWKPRMDTDACGESDKAHVF
jgi:hypothetical protein